MDIDGGTNRSLQVMMRAMHDAFGDSPLMAYLAMMAVRLVELHRVLKDTGSLYLHCDSTASHRLKMALDAVFGPENYRNEIVWERKADRGEANKPAMKFGVRTDIILFCAKPSRFSFHRKFRLNDPAYVESKFNNQDDDGRRLYRLDNLTSPSFHENLRYE